MTDLLTPAQIEALAAENDRTMSEVFVLAQVAPSTFSRWRAGITVPSIETYKRICDAAELPPTKAFNMGTEA